MSFFVVGLNHKTAPIDVREKFFFTAIQQELILSELKHNPAIVEGFILSTCNRTELYAKSINDKKATKEIVRCLYQIKGLKIQDSFKKNFYKFTDLEAVRHLFKVTTGLDSLVLGEREILGQVKTAVSLAQKKGMVGKYLNILSPCVIRAGKKAHTETAISYGGASVSWAAVATAERIMGTFENKKVLIMGAGKISGLTMEMIRKKGTDQIYVMNRTPEKACDLTGRFGGQAVSYGDIKEILADVDLCICSVGAPHYILEKATLDKVMQLRGGKKLILIDISMPRNIDPGISGLDGVKLIYIDDLDRVVEENMVKRKQAVGRVETIIEEKISEFQKRLEKIKELNPAGYYEEIAT